MRGEKRKGGVCVFLQSRLRNYNVHPGQWTSEGKRKNRELDSLLLSSHLMLCASSRILLPCDPPYRRAISRVSLLHSLADHDDARLLPPSVAVTGDDDPLVQLSCPPFLSLLGTLGRTAAAAVAAQQKQLNSLFRSSVSSMYRTENNNKKRSQK